MARFEMDENLHVLTPFLNQSRIFCIGTSALLEYYLDRFSAFRIISLDSDPEASKEHRNLSKANAWTLEYIATHGQQIAIAIDGDNSGFIKISKANAFMNRIPNGWNLSQWCAYTIVGSYIVYLDT